MDVRTVQGHLYTSCLCALLSEPPQPGEEGRSCAPACPCRRTKQQPAFPGSRHGAGLTRGVYHPCISRVSGLTRRLSDRPAVMSLGIKSAFSPQLLWRPLKRGVVTLATATVHRDPCSLSFPFPAPSPLGFPSPLRPPSVAPPRRVTPSGRAGRGHQRRDGDGGGGAVPGRAGAAGLPAGAARALLPALPADPARALLVPGDQQVAAGRAPPCPPGAPRPSRARPRSLPSGGRGDGEASPRRCRLPRPGSGSSAPRPEGKTPGNCPPAGGSQKMRVNVGV